MAKTKKGENTVPDDNYETDSPQEYKGMDDFNVEEDYQPIPLIAEGYYNAAVTNVRFNSEDKTGVA